MRPSARQIGVAIAEGGISAEDHARAALARVGEMAWVGALVETLPDRVLSAAREVDRSRLAGKEPGPLAGALFVAKDNIDIAGWHTSACTPALAANVPAQDAEVVARLKGAGAVVLGKAVMHELAMGGTSNNPHMPPVRNPHAPDHIAGGSSGGTAAAIAAGFASFGLGSDTGGSVPIPAALCGIAGLRPSVGRYSAQGLLVTNPSRDVIGPMACSADDLRLIDSVISGQPQQSVPEPETVRLAIPRRHFWEGADAQVREALEQAVDWLSEAGITIIETEVEDLQALNEAAAAGLRAEPTFALAAALSALDPPVTIDDLIEQTRSSAIAAALAATANGRGSREQIEEALVIHRPRLREAFHNALALAGADALLVPATPLPAVPLGSEGSLTINGQEVDFFSYTRSTLPAANAGVPFLTIPAARIGPLPLGLGMIGRHGEDGRLLATGAACETVLHRGDRPPG